MYYITTVNVLGAAFMRNILFMLMFSFFSLYARNIKPLTHEEVKQFRVLNAPSIHVSKGPSIYDAIGIFALCKQEFETRNTGCICPMEDRIEYFSRLSAAVSLGIGFDAGIINTPMNQAEASMFRGMAKSLGDQLQGAVAFVTLADASRSFERTHLQEFDNALKTGTLRGQHTIDLAGVAAEKSNAPLKAKLAREYADLPRVNNYSQDFEVALLTKVIGANPTHADMLNGFLRDTTLDNRLHVCLAAKRFVGLLPNITDDLISTENLRICLEVFRNTPSDERLLELFGALRLAKQHSQERGIVFDSSTVSTLLPKLHRMRGNLITQLSYVAQQFPRLSSSHFPDFSGFVAGEADQARKEAISSAILLSLAIDPSDESINSIKRIFMTQNLIRSIKTSHLVRFVMKSVEMVKRAEEAEKTKIIASLQRCAAYKLLELFPRDLVEPARMLEAQLDQFVGIFRFVATLPESGKDKFKNNLSLLLEAPESDDDDDHVPDPFTLDREQRIGLIACLARPSISQFPDSLVVVINRMANIQDDGQPSLDAWDFTMSESKLNAIEALLTLGQEPSDVALLIEQMYSFSDEAAGLEPVASLAERMYDRIIFNDNLPSEFRDNHSHLNFALTLLGLPSTEQDEQLRQYIRDYERVLERSRQRRVELMREQGLQIAVAVDANQRVELRHVGCMAVHRVGALLCGPLERALESVLVEKGALPSNVAEAYKLLASWSKNNPGLERALAPRMLPFDVTHNVHSILNAMMANRGEITEDLVRQGIIPHDVRDAVATLTARIQAGQASLQAPRITLGTWINGYGSSPETAEDAAAKVRIRAVLAKAQSDAYTRKAEFSGTLPKVIDYIKDKSKAERDAWLVNSFGEASQAYDANSVDGGLSCDKGIWERLLLGLKYQTQPQFDNLLAVIDLGDLTTNSFNTMQRLQSPGINDRGARIEASALWKLWDEARPPLLVAAQAVQAVDLWKLAIDRMRGSEAATVTRLLEASRTFLDRATHTALLDNFTQHVNSTADRIKSGWEAAIRNLYTNYLDIKAGRPVGGH